MGFVLPAAVAVSNKIIVDVDGDGARDGFSVRYRSQKYSL